MDLKPPGMKPQDFCRVMLLDHTPKMNTQLPLISLFEFDKRNACQVTYQKSARYVKGSIFCKKCLQNQPFVMSQGISPMALLPGVRQEAHTQCFTSGP